jgi:hypothetical protein
MKPQKIILYFFLLCLLSLSCKDSPVGPEEQFTKILFQYNFKNELNTFDCTFQKDLIINGVVKVNFWLTAEEQNSIVQKAETLGFFSMPDSILNSAPIMIMPSSNTFLRIKTETSDHSVFWDYVFEEFQPDLYEDYLKLTELSRFIQQVIEAKREYQKLPEAVGGYD